MIRADLYKGAKRLSNFIDRDASPRKDDQGKFDSHHVLFPIFRNCVHDYRDRLKYGS